MSSLENTSEEPLLFPLPEGNEADAAETTPYLHLSVARGKTGFPKRPIDTENFLIGSSEDVDLRLGGDDIPEIHSVIAISKNEVRLQWLADSPPLFLNGEEVQEATLREDDHLQIGNFFFRVHDFHPDFAIAETPAKQEDVPSPPRSLEDLMALVTEAKEAEEATLKEQSAGELVDQIVADTELVDEADATRKVGEIALVHSLVQRAADLADEVSTLEPASAESASVAMNENVLEELEKVIQELTGFSQELNERATRIADQEASHAEAAEMLLEAQQELTEQLERFQNQLEDKPAESEFPKLRKAA